MANTESLVLEEFTRSSPQNILSRSNYALVLRGLRELICPAFASPIFTDKPQVVSNILLKNLSQ